MMLVLEAGRLAGCFHGYETHTHSLLMDPKWPKVLMKSQTFSFISQSLTERWVNRLIFIADCCAELLQMALSCDPFFHTIIFPPTSFFFFYCCCTVVGNNVGVGRRFQTQIPDQRFYQWLRLAAAEGVIFCSLPDSFQKNHFNAE